MIETSLIGVGFVLIGGAFLINTRMVYNLKSKVDLLYDNLDVKFKFKENNKK